MIGADVYAGQFVTLLIFAMALGLDAFSLGLGIGLKGVRFRDIAKLVVVIGLFHVLMPIGGMLTGHLVSDLLGEVAQTVAGILLLMLGGHMIYSSFRGDDVQSFDHRSALGLLILAFSISIDAFSVGLTLGMFSASFWMTITMFGLAGALMSMFGLLLGKRVSGKMGEYGEACGGAILFVFGLFFIF